MRGDCTPGPPRNGQPVCPRRDCTCHVAGREGGAHTFSGRSVRGGGGWVATGRYWRAGGLPREDMAGSARDVEEVVNS